MKDDPGLAVNTVKTDGGITYHILFDLSQLISGYVILLSRTVKA